MGIIETGRAGGQVHRGRGSREKMGWGERAGDK